MTIRNKIIKPFFIIAIVFSFSCSSNYTPKPRGYFRITMPEKEYSRLDTTLPYSFEYPVYAKLNPAENQEGEAFWANIVYPTFDAQIHLSYKQIDGNLYELLEDNRELAYKHTVKADAIQERLFNSPEKNIYGILYEIRGNTASPLQFFVTDSTRHFLRGSLYFNSVPNKDSIAPVLNFIKEDVVNLMETFSWKNM